MVSLMDINVRQQFLPGQNFLLMSPWLRPEAFWAASRFILVPMCSPSGPNSRSACTTSIRPEINLGRPSSTRSSTTTKVSSANDSASMGAWRSTPTSCKLPSDPRTALSVSKDSRRSTSFLFFRNDSLNLFFVRLNHASRLFIFENANR